MGERADPAGLARRAPAVRGFAAPGLRVEPEPFLGVAKLQALGAEAQARLFQPLDAAPPAPGRETCGGELRCAWLAPGEWLVTGAEPRVAALCDRIGKAGDPLILAVDLSHGRAAFLLSGTGARAALAAHCPLDLSDRAFPVGTAARSLLADAGLFVARLEDVRAEPVFRIIVDQIRAAYAARMLAGAGGIAQPPQD